MTFILDSRLESDGILLVENSNYILNLVNDKRYVWLVLIPKVADATELHDLSPEMQSDVALTSNQLAATLKENFSARKINIATIGNIVSQLHVHIVLRFAEDAAWPNPVWGRGSADPYSPDELEKMLNQLKPLLDELRW